MCFVLAMAKSLAASDFAQQGDQEGGTGGRALEN